MSLQTDFEQALYGLVSKLYDERGEPLSELVFDISNHKRVFAKYLEGT